MISIVYTTHMKTPGIRFEYRDVSYYLSYFASSTSAIHSEALAFQSAGLSCLVPAYRSFCDGYAAILFDQMDGQEQALIEQMTTDEEQMLIDEINLLTVRECRFMRRIKQAQESPLGAAGSVPIEQKREFDTPEDEALYHERIQEKIDEGKQLPGCEYTTHTTTEAPYNIILKLEETLTRCQAQKLRAIDTLNKIRMSRDEGKSRDIEDMFIIRKVVFGDDQAPDT